MKIPVITAREDEASGDMANLLSPRRWQPYCFWLSLPAMAGVAALSLTYLLNPFAIPGAVPPEPPPLPVLSANPPQTIAQIQTELAGDGLMLGKPLDIAAENDTVFPVYDENKKAVREVRVYRSVEEAGEKKYLLSRKLDLVGAAEYAVRAVGWRYDREPNADALKGRRLLFQALQPIAGAAPSRGVWFLAVGQTGAFRYGKVLCYLARPQASLSVVAEWSSPTGSLPSWQEVTASPNRIIDRTALREGMPRNRTATGKAAEFPLSLQPNEPELLLDRGSPYDPDLAIFHLVSTSNAAQPLQLLRVTLDAGRRMPKLYDEALTLANAGLWSPALAKLEELRGQWQQEGRGFSAFVQAQYDAIAAHARLTALEADRPQQDVEARVLAAIADGRWQGAIEAAKTVENSPDRLENLFKTRQSFIWQRVKAAIRVDPQSAAHLWGATIVLQRQGFPAAQQWLAAKHPLTPEALALLNAFDLAPLRFNPQQVLGRVTPLGVDPPRGDWSGEVPDLLPGQTWYEVEVEVVRDGDLWRNAPFSMLAARSPQRLWRAMGLDRNSSLGVATIDSRGDVRGDLLTAHALRIGGDGRLFLLATGFPTLETAIASSILPPMAVSSGSLAETSGSLLSLGGMERDVAERIVYRLYDEFQKLGQVSVPFEQFAAQVQSWDFEQVSLAGDASPMFLLQLRREQVDLGDRKYPIVAVFDSNGRLLFSDILPTAPRQWVTLLASQNGAQVLTVANGRYEAISLR